jgi:hypothetical protein
MSQATYHLPLSVKELVHTQKRRMGSSGVRNAAVSQSADRESFAKVMTTTGGQMAVEPYEIREKLTFSIIVSSHQSNAFRRNH